MEGDSKEFLKRQLRLEVSRLYKRDHTRWKEPIWKVLDRIKESDLKAVFFGGTLRSILTSRIFNRRLGRPRDIDLVVSNVSVDVLREKFSELVTKENRFGGLRLKQREWDFDVWPVDRTWAYVQGSVESRSFESLPSTTFLNLEAIAVEVIARPGQPRAIFSGDDQFFEGIMSRTLEINKAQNPFPELSVVRALVLAAGLHFKIGPKLSAYIAVRGAALTEDVLIDVQMHHYGQLRARAGDLRKWIDWISEEHVKSPSVAITVPFPSQLELWTRHSEYTGVHMHTLQARVPYSLNSAMTV